MNGSFYQWLTKYARRKQSLILSKDETSSMVDVKTGVICWLREQQGRNLLTDRAASGIKVA
jgi:hypothetical protein